MRSMANAKLAKKYLTFYRTQPGGYGAGDRFLGVRVPVSRKIAAENVSLPLDQLRKLAESRFHEERFVALVILVLQFNTAKKEEERKRLFDAYVQMVRSGKVVNNWDLVDASAPYMGAYLIGDPKSREFLLKLVQSRNLWTQRVAILMTFSFIRNGDNRPTLLLAKRLLSHPHDLIHKASGWMLREVGKNSLSDLRKFLTKHSARMPRTMLRYSIEKMQKRERQKWLSTVARQKA